MTIDFELEPDPSVNNHSKIEHVIDKSNISSTNRLTIQHFAEKLLAVDPKRRLGYNGIDDFKKHPYLKGINWEELERKASQSQPQQGGILVMGMSQKTAADKTVYGYKYGLNEFT